MATSPASEVVRQLRRAVLLRDAADRTDRQLLEAFLHCRDDAAFAALVQRHGPMVWAVCRRILCNYHDVEDAFQATFLVLVRKATAIAPREMVANWLYGIAHRTALKARATAAKRVRREKQVIQMPEPATADEKLWSDLRPLLDLELSRLPDKYRAVVVLCDLEGKTRKQAAQQLGCPEGTVAGRLARARALLEKRLARRGLGISGAALAALLARDTATAGLPPSLVSATIKAGLFLAAGRAAATAAISANVAALLEGVLKAMLMTKLRTPAALFLASLFLVGLGFGVVSGLTFSPTDQKPLSQPPAAALKQEKPSSSSAAPTPSVPLRALTLVQAYQNNDALVDESFADQEIEVTGEAGPIRRLSPEGKPVYVLFMSSGVAPNPYVQFYGDVGVVKHDRIGLLAFEFSEKERKQLAAVRLGNPVAIRGLCKGKSVIRVNGNDQPVILIRNCVIVDAKPTAGTAAAAASPGK